MGEALDMRRMSWALEPAPVLREGTVTDGPVELWMVVTDAQRRPLALGQVRMTDLTPHARDGLLTMETTTSMAVVQAGLPHLAMLVMVNQVDKTYVPVFPIFLADPTTPLKRDDTITNTWQWIIHHPTERP